MEWHNINTLIIYRKKIMKLMIYYISQVRFVITQEYIAAYHVAMRLHLIRGIHFLHKIIINTLLV